ncbi:MAG: hypothetical protein JXN59_19195 [Anaerolineae bacterium]|nr:hypothetical protein [Anaerolineae bacterium]
MEARGKLSTEELALAFLIGFGLLLMILAGGFGTALDNANPVVFGTIFGLGLAALLIGIVLWMAFVRPWTQFDDINVPKDAGHHGHGEAH